MPTQHYENHAKYDAPHHFVFYPVVFITLAFSIRCIFKYEGRQGEWMIISIALMLIGWLSFMVRQHYALNNQNRIVRLEMRLRYYILSNKRFEALEKQLSFGQIAALRFASDEELLSLIDRTLKENLSPDVIKRSIVNWLPDEMRV